MDQSEFSIYERLPDDLLCEFYFEILKNIEKGILTDAMYQEVELIKKAAAKRRLTLMDLHRKRFYLKKI